MCSRRFHSLDIIHSGIPDGRKLKERISSQAARIFADQPPDRRLAAFTPRRPLAFHSEADRVPSFYALSPTTVIYTANEAHPDDMIMVKCIIASFDWFVLHVAGPGIVIWQRQALNGRRSSNLDGP